MKVSFFSKMSSSCFLSPSPLSLSTTTTPLVRFNPTKCKALSVSGDYSCFQVKGLTYRPPGTENNLLNDVNFSLHEKSLGLIFGRSGSGKTTLLQLLAGLVKPTSGSIHIQKYDKDGIPNQAPELLPPERVGIVFQFPEREKRLETNWKTEDFLFHQKLDVFSMQVTGFRRVCAGPSDHFGFYISRLNTQQRILGLRYFLADTVLEEVTFGWPRQKGSAQVKEQLALRLQRAITSVGMNGISLDEDPHALSGGYKRRLALAIQLVQVPDLLILDEPLAGLDWKARADVVKLLKHLKKELTLLVVSHDLKELSNLVDQSWRMEMGGVLKEEPLPI
ncbi:hypothetical protein C5167_022347 [Papaver somniferum]|uniref:ABC transporter domain-containing protein n=1 Tax=Papaver somniferum TaxID=3469 RepID=A0A4Y7JLC8_PAPSO|nr:hypothetical protein C5167_022347 [Papaver somniferum]